MNNDSKTLKIKVINKSNNKLPKYETKAAAGMDLLANIENKIILKPFERSLIPTGLYLEIPTGYEAQIRARSGLAIKHGISLVNGIGTIDSDYRGEVKIILINLGDKDFTINPSDKIAQIIFSKHEMAELIETEVLEDTERGDGGFGHTGI